MVPKLKKIISNSVNLARELGDVEVKPEHLLLSIIDDNDNDCVKVLNNMGYDLSKIYETIHLLLINSDLTPKVRRISVQYNKEVKSLLETIDSEAKLLNDNHIDTNHLILGLLNSETRIKTTLKDDYNLTYERYVKTVKKTKENITNNADEYDPNYDSSEKYNKSTKKSMVTKTPVLDNFCSDITKLVEENKIDQVIGRADEIKRVIQILSRRRKNNPILIGEAGAGKSAIAEGIALLIKGDNPPINLIGKRLLSLDLTSMIAGTKFRGQFEERAKAILDELKQNRDVILFIDEIHTFIGAGSASGSLDAANIFKPALSRGEIQVIGATTLDEFREHVEKDKALVRRFQQVIIEPTTVEQTKEILSKIKTVYEKHHRVQYTDEAINDCVVLADRYITDRAMPDKAIDILDEAGASTNVSYEIPENIKLLESQKEEIIKKKMEVVQQQNYEIAAELRDSEAKIKEELVKAKSEWMSGLNKKRTIVDSKIIHETISMMTGIPLTKLSTKENKKLLSMDKNLMGKVIGQDEAVTKVIKAIKRNRVGIRDKSRVMSAMMFTGASGVGKTLLTKLLAEEIFGDSSALVRIDMSEYMEKHTVSKLIGSPPGYVGFEAGGQLTEKIRRKPYSLVLFDEIEKAHEDVYDLLLQLLDEGHLTDNIGRKINFKNCLVIMTSNIGVKELNCFGSSMGFQTESVNKNDEERKKSIIEKALKKRFKPEFLNRLDDIITFNSLKEDDIHKIVSLETDKLKGRLDELGFSLKIHKSVIEFIAKNGYDENYGARPIKRAIQKYIEDPLADEILNETFVEGDTINIILNKEKTEVLMKKV
jgi:ATP-dependent Clp protease ATP-binding subunit ClpC